MQSVKFQPVYAHRTHTKADPIPTLFLMNIASRFHPVLLLNDFGCNYPSLLPSRLQLSESLQLSVKMATNSPQPLAVFLGKGFSIRCNPGWLKFSIDELSPHLHLRLGSISRPTDTYEISILCSENPHTAGVRYYTTGRHIDTVFIDFGDNPTLVASWHLPPWNNDQDQCVKFHVNVTETGFIRVECIQAIKLHTARLSFVRRSSLMLPVNSEAVQNIFPGVDLTVLTAP
ncbi:hypothetical protein F4778DRAFT_132843 [Xylariomycetidae sp. FL2044]|nr:hypothetical protein F4778DRAFT_132843 [Xylariomycetidae sp. FL2044]